MIKKRLKIIKKDNKGLLYSTELLLTIILVIFIIGIVLNLSDDLNEKVLSAEELSSLEEITIETSDYLLNNPGNPQDWEDDEGLNNGIVSKNIIPGLAIKDKEVENSMFYSESKDEEEVLSNSISYEKLIKLKNNYDDLINRNLLNNSYKSSIIISPVNNNNNLNKIILGDNLEENENTVVVNRIVRCNYYTNFVISKFNDLNLYRKDYARENNCNHDTNPLLENHTNDINSIWLCKNFRVYKSSLKNYNFYLISDEKIRHSNCYYILESLNRTSDKKERLNQEVIDLNPYFTKDLENSSNEIYSIHFNIPKKDIEDFNTVLVAIPNNMSEEIISNNQLKYDYFSVQEVNFTFKMAYK